MAFHSSIVFAPGRRPGPLEVLGSVGVGGMGEGAAINVRLAHRDLKPENLINVDLSFDEIRSRSEFSAILEQAGV